MFETVIELYEFTQGSNKFRFCSAAKAYTYKGFKYLPLRGVTRTEIVDEDINQCSFEATIPLKQRNTEAASSLNTFLDFFKNLVFYGGIKITLTELTIETGIGVTQFIGRVSYPKLFRTKGYLLLSCESNESQQRRSINVRKLQASCNNKMFDRFCGLNYNDWFFKALVIATDNALQNPTIQFEVVETPLLDEHGDPVVDELGDPVFETLAYPDAYLNGGMLRSNSQFKTIVNHTGNTLTMYSHDFSVKVGDIVELVPACNLSLASCKRFNNETRFCGFLNVPNENPINAQFIK